LLYTRWDTLYLSLGCSKLKLNSPSTDRFRIYEAYWRLERSQNWHIWKTPTNCYWQVSETISERLDYSEIANYSNYYCSIYEHCKESKDSIEWDKPLEKGDKVSVNSYMLNITKDISTMHKILSSLLPR
jgi:hypothetical protein